MRDPRDVIVSFYHYAIKTRAIKENFDIEAGVEAFLNGDIQGDHFGTWGENVGSWLGAREHDPNFLIIRYEDLLTMPNQEVKKIAEFLKLETSDELISHAIEASSFENMQQLEIKQSRNPFIRGALKGRKDKLFIRKGESGGWQGEISETSARKIEEKWKIWMIKFGYL